MEILKNDKLTVEVSSHGAELQSIKNAEGHEYLWQGDEKYWPRRSPASSVTPADVSSPRDLR